MPPLSFSQVLRRNLDSGNTSAEFLDQWKNPSDVFSVLLILGGDVVARAQAQLAGSYFTPVAFSFGWVAYAISAVVSAIGENKLMPPPDIACKVINGQSGYVRDNTSWIIGRIVRDYESWMDAGNNDGPIRACVKKMIAEEWWALQEKAEKEIPGSKNTVPEPTSVGLCVSIYRARPAMQGYSGRDTLYYTGFLIAILQLGVASIPCGLYGDYGILLVTACGILLAFVTGALRQWKREKWACRANFKKKTVILTRGNGSQHAIVIIGEGKDLDLEDLSTSAYSTVSSASVSTQIQMVVIALLWILLLITAAGLRQNTWYLLAVGASGIVQNMYVAAAPRTPEAFGAPLEYVNVIGRRKVMDALLAVEEAYPNVGRSMRETFFPGELRPAEIKRWAELKMVADAPVQQT